jgi:hypothetical protein
MVCQRKTPFLHENEGYLLPLLQEACQVVGRSFVVEG